MRLRSAIPEFSASPWRVFAMVLLLVFAFEGLIMLALAHLSPWPAGSFSEGAADAALLSTALAPALWFLVVRPLRRVARDRGELLARLFEAQESERRRLGRDLHDSLGQSLTALSVGLRSLEQAGASPEARSRAGDLLRFTAEALTEMRRISRGLRTDVLEDFGLATAVRRLCEDHAAAHAGAGAPALQTEIALPESARFEPSLEAAFYRVLQEALTNAAKHAGAGRVEVRLAEHHGLLRLTVRDDGAGFEPEPGGPRSGGRASIGLRSMRERMELVGGRLSVDSAPGRGASVTAEAPATRVPASR